jgi:hypothetical protein
VKVLVACEFSGIVRDAFVAKGHDAWSCDLIETDRRRRYYADDGTPIFDPTCGPHLVGHVELFLNCGWDLMIAHPPCTYLCVPGAHYLHKQSGRWEKMIVARDFFMHLLLCSKIQRICIENPLPHRYAELPKYSQIIQPWQFGHELSKRTCLWLRGLPMLRPTDIRSNHGERYTRSERQQKMGYGKTSNSKWYASASAKERSRTFPGIAQAMAEQWGGTA